MMVYFNYSVNDGRAGDGGLETQVVYSFDIRYHSSLSSLYICELCENKSQKQDYFYMYIYF